MASDRQIRANRVNARKSTGPKSSQGLARSSRNALSHGLSLPLAAEDLVIAGELANVFCGRACEASAEFSVAHAEIMRARGARLNALEALLSQAPGPTAGPAPVAIPAPGLRPAPGRGHSIRSILNMDRYERVAGQKRRRALLTMRD